MDCQLEFIEMMAFGCCKLQSESVTSPSLASCFTGNTLALSSQQTFHGNFMSHLEAMFKYSLLEQGALAPHLPTRTNVTDAEVMLRR